MIHSRKMARIFAAALLILMAVFFTAQFKAKAAEATESDTEEAEEEKDDSATKGKAVAAAVAIGLAAVAGAFSMAIAISKSNESIARQPEAEGSIRSALMLGLVFIETVVIYALIVAILIVFVM